MPELTHFDAKGNAVMVDVSGKDVTERVAVAQCSVTMQPATLKRIVDHDIKKGDVLGIARVAGIMAAKRTHELIPLCHPLPLTAVNVDLVADAARNCVDITATAKVTGRTGVEMESLTAAAVAALTVYDMCKAIDSGKTVLAIAIKHKTVGECGTT